MWDGRTTNDKRTREDRATQPNGCWMAEFRNYQSSSVGPQHLLTIEYPEKSQRTWKNPLNTDSRTGIQSAPCDFWGSISICIRTAHGND